MKPSGLDGVSNSFFGLFLENTLDFLFVGKLFHFEQRMLKNYCLIKVLTESKSFRLSDECCGPAQSGKNTIRLQSISGHKT
jgi:hypothetical protein